MGNVLDDIIAGVITAVVFGYFVLCVVSWFLFGGVTVKALVEKMLKRDQPAPGC